MLARSAETSNNYERNNPSQDISTSAGPAQHNAYGIDQEEIDRLIAQQQAGSAEDFEFSRNIEDENVIGEPERVGSLMDQSEIDRMIQQGVPHRAQSPQNSPQKSPGMGLGQNEIDQLFSGKSAQAMKDPNASVNKNPFAEVERGVGDLAQDEIDRLFSGGGTASPKQEAKKQQISIADIPETGDLDQAAIDALFAQASGKPKAVSPANDQSAIATKEGEPANAIVPRVKEIPNAFGAKTLSPQDFSSKKVLKAWSNPNVTGVRQARFFLPNQVHENETALNAIMRLFALARAFRNIPSGKSHDEIAAFSNRFGQNTNIYLTRDEALPVRIQVSGINTFSIYNRFEDSKQTYTINSFLPGSGGQSRRWVDWFSANYDPETLQQISLLS